MRFLIKLNFENCYYYVLLRGSWWHIFTTAFDKLKICIWDDLKRLKIYLIKYIKARSRRLNWKAASHHTRSASQCVSIMFSIEIKSFCHSPALSVDHRAWRIFKSRKLIFTSGPLTRIDLSSPNFSFQIWTILNKKNLFFNFSHIFLLLQ